MRTIYKYPIPIEQVSSTDGAFFIQTHGGAKVVHIELDPTQEPCIWMEVETGELTKARLFYLVPTGRVIPNSPLGKLHHLATFIKNGLVFHVYEPKSLL